MTRTGTIPTERVEDAHPEDARLPERIEAALSHFLERRRADTAAIDHVFAEAADVLVQFVLGGGKRIRPTFAWWGWRGAGGSPDAPDVLTAISALELVQACALIHDDLMDASATRRGRPTVHVGFARRHAGAGWHGHPARFGAAAAIILGDLALVWADDMLRSAGLPPDASARATVPWQAMRTEVLGGQYLDVLVQATGDTSAHAALQIDRYKTAA
ncbi:MAG TPA: polyprenyl synthetase family protein, partial [Pseudonocardia sp.]|nr:polyprenyl synthetase family protein [Pseudonocardia sp.]